jgi:predicted nucleotidyltransferase component of viral defense system
MLDDVAVREAFHVHFLRNLVRSMDPRLFRLKGGVNFRLYFGSIRYSEDIDLDADRGARPTLRREIGRLLHDATFLGQLAVLGIRGVDARTAPNKDTETTLRYKARIVSPGGVPLPTKVEVSFRREESAEEGTLEAADERVTSQYLSAADRPLQVMHYTVMPAVRQKIAALAHRAEVQARDVFDLAMLAERRTDTLDLPFLRTRLTDDELREAHRRALSLPYDAYRTTVVEFLDLSERGNVASERAWDEQRLFAAALIEAIQRDVPR